MLMCERPSPRCIQCLRHAFMQGIEGVPKISQDYNPATWMLEVTNVAVENRTGQDFAAPVCRQRHVQVHAACLQGFQKMIG